MKKRKKLFLVLPVRHEWGLEKYLAKIFDILAQTDYEWKVVVLVNNSTEKYENWVNSIARKTSDTKVAASYLGYNVTKYANIDVVQLGDLKAKGKTFAFAYVFGFSYSISCGADHVIETDAGGSFDPNDLPRFIKGLESGTNVFSTRFDIFGGAKNMYPPARVVISLIGTILANLVLGFGRFVSDATSGYEAFQVTTLKRVFQIVPIDSWIATKDVPHFIQTEIRAYILWLERKGECKVSFLPIVMGAHLEETPPNLAPKTILESFKCLIELRSRRKLFN